MLSLNEQFEQCSAARQKLRPISDLTVIAYIPTAQHGWRNCYYADNRPETPHGAEGLTRCLWFDDHGRQVTTYVPNEDVDYDLSKEKQPEINPDKPVFKVTDPKVIARIDADLKRNRAIRAAIESGMSVDEIEAKFDVKFYRHTEPRVS